MPGLDGASVAVREHLVLARRRFQKVLRSLQFWFLARLAIFCSLYCPGSSAGQ